MEPSFAAIADDLFNFFLLFLHLRLGAGAKDKIGVVVVVITDEASYFLSLEVVKGEELTFVLM